MQNLVNYAIRYAEKGFSVLPMANKKPLIAFANRPPLTVAEIKQIWKSNPTANIALRTTNFFVIDIDRHANGADGFKSIQQLGHPELFKKTLKQRTAGGGCQLFYLKREDMRIHQLIGWLPGVDVKAHINNYVVVPPSQINGKPYQWANRLPIVTASLDLIKTINRKRATSHYQPDTAIVNTGKRTITTLLFEQIASGLGNVGGRNNQLAALIGGLLFRNVKVKAAYQLACLANQNTTDALPQREVDRTFESIVQAEIRRKEVNTT